MSKFTFDDYNTLTSKAQNGTTSAAKVGYFKLGENEEALVRINLDTVTQIPFATVHKPIYGKSFEGLSNPYAGISCYNEVGSYSDNCPLCKAVAAKHPVINKAEKKCYIPMLVSYRDKTTGTWSTPVAVVWERPASYAREIATKLSTYGPLSQILFKMTRVGSGKETRYSLDYAVPTIFKPEMVPADFSAFENFQVNKHSYWELSREEIEDYINTGAFHIEKTNATNTDTVSNTANTYVEKAAAVETQPTQATTTNTNTTANKFSNFTF